MFRSKFRDVHRMLDASIDLLVGAALPRYALDTFCEDIIISGILGERKPLALSTWCDRTGLSEFPPLTDCLERRAWAERVQIDLAALRCYARAVYAESDAYLARLALPQPDDLTARLLNALLVKLLMSALTPAG